MPSAALHVHATSPPPWAPHRAAHSPSCALQPSCAPLCAVPVRRPPCAPRRPVSLQTAVALQRCELVAFPAAPLLALLASLEAPPPGSEAAALLGTAPAVATAGGEKGEQRARGAPGARGGLPGKLAAAAAAAQRRLMAAGGGGGLSRPDPRVRPGGGMCCAARAGLA
jgi:hypothetical protein